MINSGASTGAQDVHVEENVSGAHSSSDAAQVSVIMVLHNSEGALTDSIPALAAEFRRLGNEFKSEALFIDNASATDPTGLVERLLPTGRVLSEQNLGFGAGCNAGARESQAEYLFFVNPDVVLDPGCIAELVKVLESAPGAWAVTGRLRNPDGSFQPSCRQLPAGLNMFGSRGSALQALLRKKKNSVNSNYTLPDYPVNTPVPAAAAAAFLIRRDKFNELGGFDARFFMFMEDTDLSAEIHARGGKIYFCPKAGGVHAWGAGSTASALNRSRWHHVSVWRYFQKRLPGFFSAVALPIALTINFFLTACIRMLRKG